MKSISTATTTDEQPIPTTVVTGFLGAGKTTIITHLVEKLQKQDIQVVYIKNEIGDADIDSKIMTGKNIRSQELLNGCICCTLVGPFHNAILEIVQQFKPDRIIIEASGAADPAALALMVDAHPNLMRDGVVSVVDVVNFQGYQDLSTTARNQTKFTDLLIFNKIEQTDLQRKQAVVGYVRELNSHAPIIEAPRGKVSPQVVFGIASQDLRQILKKHEQVPSENQTQESHPHKHVENDGIEAFHISIESEFDKTGLEKWLLTLPKQVFRVKGLVKLDDQSWQVVNRVGVRVDLKPAPADLQVTKTLLIFIGFNIKRYKAKFQEDLESIASGST